MGQDKSRSGQAVTETQDPQQLREEIEQTREELGDTVEALSAKTDLKAQAKRKAKEAKANPLPVAAAGTFLAGFLIGRITKH